MTHSAGGAIYLSEVHTIVKGGDANVGVKLIRWWRKPGYLVKTTA